MASSVLGSVTGKISDVLGWNAPPATTTPTEPNFPQVPGDAIREARIRNANYSARERGVFNEERDDREKNWFNGNGLAQEAPPKGEEKMD